MASTQKGGRLSGVARPSAARRRRRALRDWGRGGRRADTAEGGARRDVSGPRLQVLRLRRDLATVKMEAAAMAEKRDEAGHQVAELHKKLVAHTAAMRRRGGWFE